MRDTHATRTPAPPPSIPAARPPSQHPPTPYLATLRYLPDEDRLGTLEASLHYRHLAPTAPDTLGCYPYIEADPFIMPECPHVYFAGNQPGFQTKLVDGAAGQKVRLVMVPDFRIEPTCVLVDLHTLDCTPISFAGLG